jgi:hypothetical protein
MRAAAKNFETPSLILSDLAVATRDSNDTSWGCWWEWVLSSCQSSPRSLTKAISCSEMHHSFWNSAIAARTPLHSSGGPIFFMFCVQHRSGGCRHYFFFFNLFVERSFVRQCLPLQTCQVLNSIHQTFAYVARVKWRGAFIQSMAELACFGSKSLMKQVKHIDNELKNESLVAHHIHSFILFQ